MPRVKVEIPSVRVDLPSLPRIRTGNATPKDYVTSRPGILRIAQLILALIIEIVRKCIDELHVNSGAEGGDTTKASGAYGWLWSEAFWSVILFICIIVCILLLIVSIVLHCTGKNVPHEFWLCVFGAVVYFILAIVSFCLLTYDGYRGVFIAVGVLCIIEGVLFVVDAYDRKRN